MVDQPKKIFGYAAMEAGKDLAPYEFTEPALDHDEVEVKMLCSGICYSDIDAVSGKYGPMYPFPVVAGHEGVGRVTAVGRTVQHLAVGQLVGLGVYRRACFGCLDCTNGKSNLCSKKELMFAGGRHGTFTQYSRIKSHFAFPIPDGILPEHAGPLMCAGLTVFAPFRNNNIQAGESIGVVGIGGLGHLALQFGRAFGCDMYALSTTADKESECRGNGANHFVLLSDAAQKASIKGKLNYILITASGGNFDVNYYLEALAPNGKIILMGALLGEVKLNPIHLIMGQKSIGGSAAGSAGIAHDMLRFCAVNKIKPMIEKFNFSDINLAIKKVKENKVRYRAVLVWDH